MQPFCFCSHVSWAELFFWSQTHSMNSAQVNLRLPTVKRPINVKFYHTAQPQMSQVFREGAVDCRNVRIGWPVVVEGLWYGQAHLGLSSTTINLCCSMIMLGPALQGSVHNSRRFSHGWQTRHCACSRCSGSACTTKRSISCHFQYRLLWASEGASV